MTKHELTEFLLSLYNHSFWNFSDEIHKGNGVISSVDLSRYAKDLINGDIDFGIHYANNTFDFKFDNGEVYATYNCKVTYSNYYELIQFADMLNIRIKLYDLGIHRFAVQRATKNNDYKMAKSLLLAFMDHYDGVAPIMGKVYESEYDQPTIEIKDKNHLLYYIDSRIPFIVSLLLDERHTSIGFRYPNAKTCVVTTLLRLPISSHETENLKHYKLMQNI